MSAHVPPPESVPTTDAPLLAGRYRLLDPLGQGGMGAVFRAFDVNLSRQVAIKLLPADKLSDAGAVARFKREALALARLSHPNIVQAFDSGQDGGRHFLVMELVEGHSLAALLAQQGKIAATRAADYACQVARALQHAHASGLIHRDIKPSNVLVTADGCAKLLDLGLARFLQDQVGDASLTRAGAGMGTPDYCAPEQFRNAHAADRRSDVYALGCTLYHLIAGRPPFPGSSLSEKAAAHECQEPTTLEQLCPEAPAGLALAVRRMMAKRPEDRFQSVAQVAEALAPYAAVSSPSFQELQTTATWDGSQLTTAFGQPRRRKVRLLALVGLVVLVLGGAVGWLGRDQGWFRDQPGVAAAGDGDDPGAKDNTASSEPGKDSQKAAPLPDEPGVLTVSQKPEGGGKYRSIAEALQAVRPHQTIRIVDDGVYLDPLLINRKSIHEGITIEAPRGAVLEKRGKAFNLLTIRGVRGVTLRNLRLRAADKERGVLVFVNGTCSDITVERTDFEMGESHLSSQGTIGIEVLDLPANIEGDSPNLLVRDCRFIQIQSGIHLSGVDPAEEGYGPSNPVCSVAIRDNQFLDGSWGVHIRGDVRKVQVVGNRFRGCSKCAWQIEHLLQQSRDLLVANNTTSECTSMLFWDDRAPRRDVRICNNLTLDANYPDAKAIDSGGSSRIPRGPEDGSKYTARWAFDHNWREVKLPAKPSSEPDGWVPPGKLDKRLDKIEGVERDPRSPDFLRPKADSPLASGGAGQDDPTLPSYVGALPPEGVEPWDWDRAWRMPKGAALLKVSKRSSDGGTYRRIADALKDATPWATIRVLDDRAYQETISLEDEKKHTGLTIEATNGATLRLAAPSIHLVSLRDVPHVCVRGFTLTDDDIGKDTSRAFVVVRGKASGVVLSRLRLVAHHAMFGVQVQNAASLPGQPPLLVKDCVIRPKCSLSNDGISVIGSDSQEPTRGVLVVGNQVSHCVRGIIVSGRLLDVDVVGNLVASSAHSALQVENLVPGSRGVRFANNTAYRSGFCFRIWDDLPPPEHGPGQVEVVNNLLFDGNDGDLSLVLGEGNNWTTGDARALFKLWSFHHNRRDFSGAKPRFSIPTSATDGKFNRTELAAVSVEDLTRTRPAKDSSLASGGAGAKGDGLPAYIGALPPEGVKPWDWERTWRVKSRNQVTRSEAQHK